MEAEKAARRLIDDKSGDKTNEKKEGLADFERLLFGKKTGLGNTNNKLRLRILSNTLKFYRNLKEKEHKKQNNEQLNNDSLKAAIIKDIVSNN